MKKKENFIVRSIGGSNVMMPVGETALKFYGLITATETGAFIWKHIEEVSDAEEMAKLICEEFEVEEAVASDDCKLVIEQMKTAGWIE